MFSYHHNNTQKIAEVIAKVLHAKIKIPEKVKPEVILEYTLIGFGSGIYGAKHHKSLLDLADCQACHIGKKGYQASANFLAGFDGGIMCLADMIGHRLGRYQYETVSVEINFSHTDKFQVPVCFNVF